LLISACGDDEGYEDEFYEEEVYTEEADETEEEEPSASQDSDDPVNASASGEVIFDFGFTPEQNGFSFENYGSDIPATNLTADELRRMFGDEVCADLNGDQCILTPPAEQWMEQINESMGGGHCEGMAVLSLMMYTGQVSPTDFGGNLASDLDVNDEALQKEIAYWWATQAVDPTASSVIRGTPMEILETVRQMDVNGETYTIGIYNDRGEGHAITPFGVEDKGDGLYAILVYDNNYPGETRELFIDSRDGSWTYETSINPEVATDVWSGNADTQTLDLTPTSTSRLVPSVMADKPALANWQLPAHLSTSSFWMEKVISLLLMKAETASAMWMEPSSTKLMALLITNTECLPAEILLNPFTRFPPTWM
jgi:hypothetical protein